MRVKEIILKPIISQFAKRFVIKHHYSHKVVNNSTFHLGCFYKNVLHGVLSFGSPLDKSKVINLVKGTLWNEMLELNRMAFDDFLPRNSESRCLAISFNLIKKYYPQIKWILSFADACQCGDGAIYRASGFILTGFSTGQLLELPDDLAKLNKGKIAHRMSIQCKTSLLSKEVLKRTKGKNLTMKGCTQLLGGRLVEGYMFRYIKLLKPNLELNCSIIPFKQIHELGGSMYLGKKKNK